MIRFDFQMVKWLYSVQEEEIKTDIFDSSKKKHTDTTLKNETINQ